MKRLIECGVLLAAVIMGSGCQTSEPVETGQDILLAPDKMISVQQLAQRLGLTVEVNTPSMITLHNAANHVTVVPDAGGQAFINGKPVKTQVNFVQVKGVLFVPDTLEGDIRAVLVPPPEPASPAPAAQPLPGTTGPPSSQAPAPKPLPGTTGPPLARARRIVVDPGHGGADPGTISRSGLQEKAVTLPVAEKLAQLLKQDGFEVALTRQSDDFVDLNDRAAIANRFAPDLLVSIQADGCASPSVKGFTVYTCRDASTESRVAAKAVAKELYLAGVEGLGLRQTDFRILTCTECPAGILVELGFLSNKDDAAMLADSAAQARLARAIADGIAEYFKR